jgi:hypothetical protein
MGQRAVIRGNKILYDVEAKKSTPNDTVARANRQDMKYRHRKELLQPNQVDYYKAHKDQLKDLPDETQRLLS